MWHIQGQSWGYNEQKCTPLDAGPRENYFTKRGAPKNWHMKKGPFNRLTFAAPAGPPLFISWFCRAPQNQLMKRGAPQGPAKVGLLNEGPCENSELNESPAQVSPWNEGPRANKPMKSGGPPKSSHTERPRASKYMKWGDPQGPRKISSKSWAI